MDREAEGSEVEGNSWAAQKDFVIALALALALEPPIVMGAHRGATQVRMSDGPACAGSQSSRGADGGKGKTLSLSNE